MAVLVSPGVQVREIDLSLYVPALATTILGLVGTATRGLTDVATLITNVDDLARNFGNSDPNHPAILTAQWYLKFGRQLEFVRVANQSLLASASVGLLTSANGPAVLTGTVAGPFAVTISTAGKTSGTEVGPFNISTGVNDKLKVDVDDAGTPQTVTFAPGTGVTAQTIADQINAQTNGLTASVNGSQQIVITSNTTGVNSEIDIQTVANNAYVTLGLIVGEYTGLDGNDTLLISINGGADQLITLTPGTSRSTQQVVADINAILAGATAFEFGGVVQIVTTLTGTGAHIHVQAASLADTLLGFTNTTQDGTAAGANSVTVSANTPGSWGNALQIQVTDSVSVSGTKNIAVLLSGHVAEVWRNLSKNSSSPAYWETVINGHSAYIEVTDHTGVGAQPGNATSTLVNGNDGLSGISDADFIGVVQNDGTKTGLQQLGDKNVIDVNLIAIPGQTSMAVHSAMISLCQSRADCMCIVDPAQGLTPQEVVEFKTATGPYSSSRVALDNNYSAMYYPWVQAFDPFNGVIVVLPPSAAAIRAYIFNDTVGELWFAPMGVNRAVITEVIGLEVVVGQQEMKLSDGQKDFLYENGINPIMSYTSYGVVIMGQKTLQFAPTSLDRVNVRRMMLYLEKIIATAVFPLIGEPNTPRLWRRATALVMPSIQYVADREGITAWQVVCDRSTNPQDLVNKHELHMKIGILPTAAAEFIYIDFVLVDSMTTFQEYLAPVA